MTDLTPISNDLVRLHITPFNPSVYEKIIPAAFRTPEHPVSFHAVQTFPDRGFGYLELPKTDAEALKRKLNGSMLQGTKIRIEEAKPIMKRRRESDEEEAFVEPRRKKRVSTKEEQVKMGEQVLSGYDIGPDRHIKRGWTEDRPKRATSTTTKAATEKKLLFKTVVPPNMTQIDLDKDKIKKRSSKRGDKPKVKGEVVIEEFSKSRSTFAVSTASSEHRIAAVAYEDGLGWVDEDGQVVEAETAKLKRQHQQDNAGQEVTNRAVATQPIQIKVSDRDSESDNSEATDSDNSEVTGTHNSVADVADSDDEGLSPKKNSSLEESTSDGENDSVEGESDSDGSTATSEAPSNAESVDGKAYADIHPLEALYKRPKDDKADAKDLLAPINTSFSFFGAHEDEDPDMMPPQTPHTRQDLEWRHQRSAAPTPDTAAIDGRFGIPSNASDDEAEEIDQFPPLTLEHTPATNGHQHESAFRKFFYEKRGDTDRAWKKRRREAKKLQRQRENRKISRRVI